MKRGNQLFTFKANKNLYKLIISLTTHNVVYFIKKYLPSKRT